jgi:hypothetical protein
MIEPDISSKNICGPVETSLLAEMRCTSSASTALERTQSGAWIEVENIE